MTKLYASDDKSFSNEKALPGTGAGLGVRSGGDAVPPLIVALFAIDVALGVMNLIRYETSGSGRSKVMWLFALGGEGNVGTWYSSVQLALVGAALGVFAYVMTAARRPRAWLLWLAPAAFLFLSADEALGLHEWISDILMPRLGITDNAATALPKTGYWMLLLAPAFVLAMATIAAATRPFWRGRRRVTVLTAAGIATFLIGSAGIEIVTNVVAAGRMENFTVTLEEFLEMVGVTLVLWGVLVLMASHGIVLAGPAIPDDGGNAEAMTGALARSTSVPAPP